MAKSPLDALSPLDGRYNETLQPIRQLFSEQALMKARLRVEITWLIALSASKKIDEIKPLTQTQQNTLMTWVDHFSLTDAEAIKTIESTTRHDVKALEYYLTEKLSQDPTLKSYVPFVHFACTSEDINNLAYAFLLNEARTTVLLPNINQFIEQLRALAHTNADVPMLALTHGQPATPTTMGKEFANVVSRLLRQTKQLTELSIMGKCNGAVGNFNAHLIAYPMIDWQSLSKSVIEKLGLEQNIYTTQIEPHDTIAEYAHILMRTNTILMDFAQDMWGYISRGYLQQKSVAKEVGSSTMPHKINPIYFENAEGNLGIANALFQHFSNKLPISRFQRDLSDSTVMRNIGVAIGHTFLAWKNLEEGLGRVAVDADAITRALSEHWEVLAEAIQTLMRRYGLPMPYEQLKALTRGNSVDATALRTFIEGLSLPADAKQSLLALTPALYIGNAASLAKSI